MCKNIHKKEIMCYDETLFMALLHLDKVTVLVLANLTSKAYIYIKVAT